MTSAFSSRTATLGLLIAESENPFHIRLIGQLEQEAEKAGFTLVVLNGERGVAAAADVFTQQQISGLLVMATDTGPQVLEPLREYQFDDIPVVVVSCGPDDSRYDQVTDDSSLGGYIATRHLLKHGHKDIGCLMGPVEKDCCRQRLQGFSLALAEDGLRPASQWIQQTEFTCEGGYRAMRKLLGQQQRPTAIFAGNDLIAMGVIKAANEAGLDVPRDLSVIGYDDIPLAEYMSPSLTTVRQASQTMAEQAIALMASRLEEPSYLYEPVLIEPQLQSRQSVAYCA